MAQLSLHLRAERQQGEGNERFRKRVQRQACLDYAERKETKAKPRDVASSFFLWLGVTV